MSAEEKRCFSERMYTLLRGSVPVPLVRGSEHIGWPDVSANWEMHIHSSGWIRLFYVRDARPGDVPVTSVAWNHNEAIFDTDEALATEVKRLYELCQGPSPFDLTSDDSACSRCMFPRPPDALAWLPDALVPLAHELGFTRDDLKPVPLLQRPPARSEDEAQPIDESVVLYRCVAAEHHPLIDRFRCGDWTARALMAQLLAGVKLPVIGLHYTVRKRTIIENHFHFEHYLYTIKSFPRMLFSCLRIKDRQIRVDLRQFAHHDMHNLTADNVEQWKQRVRHVFVLEQAVSHLADKDFVDRWRKQNAELVLQDFLLSVFHSVSLPSYVRTGPAQGHGPAAAFSRIVCGYL